MIFQLIARGLNRTVDLEVIDPKVAFRSESAFNLVLTNKIGYRCEIEFDLRADLPRIKWSFPCR